MKQDQARQALKDAYLIDFPDDLFQFWDFVNSLGADKPLNPFWGSMGLLLEGPFKILAGEIQSEPRNDWYLDSRYYDDPPEFFTVLVGDTDGLHWGYWFDDPDNSPQYCVADYYSRDAFDLTEDGATLLEAFRLHLEGCHMSTLENIETDPDAEPYKAEYQADLEAYGLIRARLMQFATADRPEIGDEYVEKYAGISERDVVVDTFEGMGIVVPESLYRPLSVNDETLRARAVADADLSEIVAEAQGALADGIPGTALKLGRDLWIGNERQKQDSYRLLSDAYGALNRPTLQTLLSRIAPVRTK